MQKSIVSLKQLKNIYDQVYEVYYLISIIDKILTTQNKLSYLEITTLSGVTTKKLNSLRKQILHMIPYTE